MVQRNTQRRLAAILAADVAGYSRLMEEDEDGTREQFNRYLNTLITPEITSHHGRIVKLMGDGLLVEFASAIDAVRCAFDIQNSMAEIKVEVPQRQRMYFRMGVNLGDVIVEGSDIHGDGVNVAARLEGLAAPDGIVVSRVVHEIVRAKVKFDFDDLGLHRLKNITEPVRAFRVRKQSDQPVCNLLSVDVRPLPNKPSIAVLPFYNLGGDPDQEYFADGITEDLITDLTKISGLFVVARNSSFAFKKAKLDTRKVARELGVRHVLEGSVRRAGNRIRINAHLVEAESREQLWAERFDGQFADIFSLQDIINARIVTALKLHLAPAETQNIIRQETRNPEAYDLFLKGRSEYYMYTQEHMTEAQRCFEKAIAKDPNYSEAYAFLSHCLTTAYVFAWSGSDDNLAAAVTLAEKSIALDDKSAIGHARLGWIQGYLDRFNEAVFNFERAIALNPRSAEAFYTYGETMNKRGYPERALPLLEQAYSIDSMVPPSWDFAKGHSLVLMRRHDEAISLFEAVMDRAPRFLPARVQLARTYFESGKVDNARKVIRSIHQLAPHFNLGFAKRMFPYPAEVQRERLLDALQAAGMVE